MAHPSPGGARATHKFEDEEQVREGDEDREAAGEGAAPRRRCGGHAGGLRRPGDGTRGSTSAVTDLWLGGAQWPGAPARGLRAGGGRSPGRRPPRPRCRRARPRGLGRRAICERCQAQLRGRPAGVPSEGGGLARRRTRCHLPRGAGRSRLGCALFTGDHHPLGMTTINTSASQTPDRTAAPLESPLVTVKLGPFTFQRRALICVISTPRFTVGANS